MSILKYLHVYSETSTNERWVRCGYLIACPLIQWCFKAMVTMAYYNIYIFYYNKYYYLFVSLNPFTSSHRVKFDSYRLTGF